MDVWLWASFQREAKHSSWMWSWRWGVLVSWLTLTTSVITSSTEWADFWRFGHDKDQSWFLGFCGHCSILWLSPFACSLNPVAQLIRCWYKRHVLTACASVRSAVQGGRSSPRGTWGHENLFESFWGRKWTIMAGRVKVSVTTQVISPGIFHDTVLLTVWLHGWFSLFDIQAISTRAEK